MPFTPLSSKAATAVVAVALCCGGAALAAYSDYEASLLHRPPPLGGSVDYDDAAAAGVARGGFAAQSASSSVVSPSGSWALTPARVTALERQLLEWQIAEGLLPAPRPPLEGTTTTTIAPPPTPTATKKPLGYANTNWTAYTTLEEPAAYASIISSNRSMFVIGGCQNATCTVRSRRSHQYDLSTGQVTRLPDLAVGVAGRASTVLVNGLLMIPRMCSFISQEEAYSATIETLRNHTVVDIIDPVTGTVSNLTYNISADKARANATCMAFTSQATSGWTVYIYGGVLLAPALTGGVPRVTAEVAALVVNDDGTADFYDDVAQLQRPTMNLASVRTTAAMYLAGGHTDLDGTPALRHYVAVPSASPMLLPLCVQEQISLYGISGVPALQETWNDLQMVAYADFHLLLAGEWMLWYIGQNTNLGDEAWHVAPANSIQFSADEIAADGTWWDRSGATLVLFPVWNPNATTPGPVEVMLFKVGGFAFYNTTVYVPTTPSPPFTIPVETTTTTTSAPTTTTTTPAPTTTTTTPAPTTTTTTAAPTPTPNVTETQRANLFARFVGWAGSGSSEDDTTTTAPASTTAAPTPSPSPTPPPNTIQVTHYGAIPNVTIALTTITLPAPSIGTTTVNVSEPLSFSLVSSETQDDGTRVCFDQAIGPGYPQCTIQPSLDSSCEVRGPKTIGLVNRDVTVPLVGLGTGTPFWLCFSFGRIIKFDNTKCGPTFLVDSYRLEPAWVLDFFNPFFIPAATSVPDTPSPSGPPGPANGGAPFLSSAWTIGLGVTAAALFGGLVMAIVVLRRRSAAAAMRGHSERYTELEEIGRGAFGRVLRVKRNSDGAIFAKKHIDCPHAEVLQEALKEFELLRTLQAHPNIIRVVDMFLNYEVVSAAPAPASSSNIDGAGSPLLNAAGRRVSSTEASPIPAAPTRHLCIVMDYHPKKDLKLWALAYPGPIPEPILCHIAVQSCSVLSFIHQKNVIHRDLKPENILIVSDHPDDNTPANLSAHHHAGSTLAPNQAAPGRTASRLSGGSGAQPLPRLTQQVVITDFGLAHLVAESRSVGFVGTAVFSAPECVALLMRQHSHSLTPPHHRGGDSPGHVESPAGGALNFTPRTGDAHRSRTTRSRHQRTASTGSGVSSQCDVWSLGCVLYAVATKRLERVNVRKMFEDVQRTDFESVIRDELMRHGYSKAFALFVLRLLKANPDERPTAKDALKYFRKSNRDHSYSVAETQKFTPQEREEMARRQRAAQEKLQREQQARAASSRGRPNVSGSTLKPSPPPSGASRGTVDSDPQLAGSRSPANPSAQFRPESAPDARTPPQGTSAERPRVAATTTPGHTNGHGNGNGLTSPRTTDAKDRAAGLKPEPPVQHQHHHQQHQQQQQHAEQLNDGNSSELDTQPTTPHIEGGDAPSDRKLE